MNQQPEVLIDDTTLKVPKLIQCDRCSQKISNSRIFKIPKHLASSGDMVCDSCYMNVTDNNQCGWHPNRLNKN